MARRFRTLAGVTTALTFVLILLGLHTGSTGGGLSCGTRWPLCNGWLGLFPANWASFFEWVHRLIAMVVGFLLLGWLYGAWRWQDDRRARYSVTAAIAILPLQILLGGVTTTADGLFPGGFNPVVMVAHFTTATVIFVLLVYATARTYDVPSVDAVRRLAAAGVGLAAVHAVFEFVSVFAYEPTNQVTYYASSFALLALLVALLTWSRSAVDPASLLRFRSIAVAATVLLCVDMVLSRQLFGVAAVVGEATTVGVVLSSVGVALAASRTVLAPGAAESRRAD